MQLPLSEARGVRMIQALFSAADPLGRVDGTGSARAYEALSVAVLASLRDGARVHDIVVLLTEHARMAAGADTVTLGPIVAFAQAVADWWVNAEGRWAPESGGGGPADAQYRKIVTGRTAG